jgi:hypothetical protein
VVIGPEQFQAPIVLSAEADTSPVDGELTLVGRALSPDRKDALRYEPGRSRVRIEPTHVARPVSDVWPGDNPNNPFGLTRRTRGLAVAIVAAEAPIQVSVTPGAAVVGRPAQVELKVEVDRAEGYDEPIEVNAADLPPNVPAAKATLAKGEVSATLTLNIPERIPTGVYTVVLRASAPYRFKQNPDDTEGSKVNLVEPSNPITVTVHE